MRKSDVSKNTDRLFSLSNHINAVNETKRPVSVSSAKRKKSKKTSDFLFYFVILSAVLIAFLLSTTTESPRTFFGYSYFQILTSSMQSEIPKGSIVITMRVDENDIHVGDDITYITYDNTIITHRVINVIEDYENSGGRGFQTQGVDNNVPDRDIVYANNVIGKVIFFSPKVGTILNTIKENVWLICISMAGILSVCISTNSNGRTTGKRRKIIKRSKS